MFRSSRSPGREWNSILSISTNMMSLRAKQSSRKTNPSANYPTRPPMPHKKLRLIPKFWKLSRKIPNPTKKYNLSKAKQKLNSSHSKKTQKLNQSKMKSSRLSKSKNNRKRSTKKNKSKSQFHRTGKLFWKSRRNRIRLISTGKKEGKSTMSSWRSIVSLWSQGRSNVWPEFPS